MHIYFLTASPKSAYTHAPVAPAPTPAWLKHPRSAPCFIYKDTSAMADIYQIPSDLVERAVAFIDAVVAGAHGVSGGAL